MNNVNIKARIRRNKLDELAGKYYQSEVSEIVSYLRSENKKALLGIMRDDGVYTVIGEERVYYLTEGGIRSDIAHGEFLDILKKNAWLKGKEGKFEYVEVNETDSIWMCNTQIMFAMWNTILFLHRANSSGK